jgi:hypothetical protein
MAKRIEYGLIESLEVINFFSNERLNHVCIIPHDQ